MAGLEGAVNESKVKPDCRLPAWSCPCVSWPIPRRQSCSASKLVCESKCLEAAERPLVVGLKVPDRTLVTPAAIPRSSADSSVGVRIVGCHIKILIGMHDFATPAVV